MEQQKLPLWKDNFRACAAINLFGSRKCKLFVTARIDDHVVMKWLDIEPELVGSGLIKIVDSGKVPALQIYGTDSYLTSEVRSSKIINEVTIEIKTINHKYKLVSDEERHERKRVSNRNPISRNKRTYTRAY